mgnify:CR=1 FL=1
MKKNLKDLSAQLYCGLSNWNDDTESSVGERFLSESEVSDLANILYDMVVDRLGEEGGLV